jgi:hypothetical protein
VSEVDDRFILLGRGGSLPSLAQIIYRMRAGAWAEEPPESAAEPILVRDVLAVMWAIADELDTQYQPLDVVAHMDLDAIGAAFQVLHDDRAALLAHLDASNETACSLDGEAVPCSSLARIVWRYMLA